MTTAGDGSASPRLVRRVSWRSGEPELEIVAPSCASHASGASGEVDERIALRGRRLSFRAVDPPGRRYCLGRDELLDGTRVHVPCPDHATVDLGRQCTACQQRDAYRFMHISHRVDFVRPELAESLRRPHRLYVASFSEKLHKVGTVVDGREHERLAEQGALVADVVAYCADGWAIRRLEDAVGAATGLPQSIRPSAKVAALASPLDPAAVRSRHRKVAALAREVVDGIGGEMAEGIEGGDEITVLDRQWESPALDAVRSSPRRLPYPLDIAVGEHGFVVRECVGATALVTVDEDPDTTFVVDLSAAVGRRIMLGNYRTSLPALQDTLF